MDEEPKQQPAEVVSDGGFIRRMQRKGVLVVTPPEPGKLNVLEKLKEVKQGKKE